VSENKAVQLDFNACAVLMFTADNIFGRFNTFSKQYIQQAIHSASNTFSKQYIQQAIHSASNTFSKQYIQQAIHSSDLYIQQVNTFSS